MIVIQGDWHHNKIIRKYFEKYKNIWGCNSEDLYYTECNGKIINYELHELSKDAIILTYKHLEEL